MKEYVSLLRGINVNGRTIKMTELKQCYESFGLSDVKTFLRSGNVIFKTNIADTESLKQALQGCVSKRFSYDAKIFVLSKEKLKPIIDRYPFDRTGDRYQHYVIFIDMDLARLLYDQGKNIVTNIDDIAIGDNVLYWKVKKGFTVKSPFSKLLIKNEFKDFHTNRNINTLIKMLV